MNSRAALTMVLQTALRGKSGEKKPGGEGQSPEVRARRQLCEVQAVDQEREYCFPPFPVVGRAKEAPLMNPRVGSREPPSGKSRGWHSCPGFML